MKLNYQYGLKLNSSDICTKSAEDLRGDSESMSYLEMNDHTLKKVVRAYGQKSQRVWKATLTEVCEYI
jgi:ribosomal protein L34E